MENAEEVMQLLEEFSKIKPKEIPRELEDYLGYVAKTGDPVYQWSLVKNLFREKLLSVITDFYESTLTVELPPCPNVDPFNYERMKTSLLERFDTFSSAPFTVQRICELLTNPRKEYNRADKYMRAIEKNILVVSTREPGSGKRPLECDSQSETVLNGIPDVKLSESDGSFLHVPTDLPYLGAPPASNDVTVETTEPNPTINDRVGLGLEINGETKAFKSDCDKPWPVHESSVVAQDTEQGSVGSDTQEEDISLHIEEKCPEENNSCDTNDSQANVDDISANISPENFEGESSSDVFTQNNESVLPDTGSIDSSQECDTEISPNINLENEESGSTSDENEVSSTPADVTVDIPLIQEEPDEPTDSEAEATDSSLKHVESVLDALPDSEVNSSDRLIETGDSKSITISEVSATKSDEVDLECNEITGTVDSPISPGNSSSLKADDLIDHNINLSELEECDQPDSHPDSSNDVCSQSKATTVLESQPKPELCTEADSMSESNIVIGLSPSELQQKNALEDSPDQTSNEIYNENSSHVSSPGDSNVSLSEEENLQKTLDESVLSSSSPKESVDQVSEGPSSHSIVEDTIKIDIQSTNEVADEMCDQERREGSVIQSVTNIPPDSQQQMSAIEEISVDPSCETEEEAMDVDDTSNQMMVSEGENEVEPMDQSDQLQS